MSGLQSLGWFGVKPEAVARGRESLAMALWRLDQSQEGQIVSQAMPDTLFLCAHLDGSIVWEAEVAERHYRRPCLAGTFNLVRPGERAAVLMRDARAVFLHAYLPMSWFAEILDSTEADITVAGLELRDAMNGRSALIHRYAASAADALRSRSPATRLQVEAAGLQLAAGLVLDHSNLGRHRIQKGGLSPWQLKRACEALEAQVDGDIGLDALAHIAGCSPTHFSRAFKQSTGVPPFAWLLGRRVERAKELLADPRVLLAEVAPAVGFSAQPQFTTAFKRVTGTTPGAWRQERPL